MTGLGKLEFDGRIVTSQFARTKRRTRKFHLTKTHESTGDCCHKRAPNLKPSLKTCGPATKPVNFFGAMRHMREKLMRCMKIVHGAGLASVGHVGCRSQQQASLL